MRTFAIINTSEGTDFSLNIINKLPSDSKIVVFQYKNQDFDCSSNTESVILPEDVKNSGSKLRNYVSKYFFDHNYKGFLHVIEDNVEVTANLTDFLEKIEEMMVKFNLKHWFNTITDVCNYTFHMYNPRFKVVIDDDECKKVYDHQINWTSHSNTSWICYDYSKAAFDDIKFNENFTIPMYYIIYFLAEKRNHKLPGELYYMNYYPTIPEEVGMFKSIPLESLLPCSSNEDMEKEGKIFSDYGINHSPDVSIENIMDDMERILKK